MNEPFQLDAFGALLSTDLPFPRRAGKVRDVYDLGDRLMIVSTDRISAFDYILPTGIPNKGRLLTAMSQFWFGKMDGGVIGGDLPRPLQHHLISVDVPDEVSQIVDGSALVGRIMVTHKADVVPFECVVRGYLEGSGWREYQDTGQVCGIALPSGLMQCDRLQSPIFTPATKAESGHDENVPFDVMASAVGDDQAGMLRDMSLAIYRDASAIAMEQGILIADTKFEFGLVDGQLMLIDEVLTPDSSRFWSADAFEPGHAQRSFDKQFVREFLMASDWDRNSPPPPLPESIARQTADRYREGYERLTGEPFI